MFTRDNYFTFHENVSFVIVTCLSSLLCGCDVWHLSNSTMHKKVSYR